MSFSQWKRFQVSPHLELKFETSNLIGQALQQQPISKCLSYVFGVYGGFWMNVVKMGEYVAEKGFIYIKIVPQWALNESTHIPMMDKIKKPDSNIITSLPVCTIIPPETCHTYNIQFELSQSKYIAP